MEAIGRQWYQLYENNPKIQAFAVINEETVLWQTDNWNLVDTIDAILEACITNKSKLEVAGVSFTTMKASDDHFIATSGDQGHFLMAKANHRDNTWIMVWTSADSDPELAIIDLRYVATKMVGF